MRSLFRYLVENGLVVNLISVFLIAIGIYAAKNINREAFPNVNLDVVAISVIHPGASPEEVERLIITPIEQELKSLDGIDKMTSVSFPGSGIINLELDPNTSNRQRIVSDVQLAVDRADLPKDLPVAPIVTEIDGRMFPVIQLAISAPTSPLELKRLGDQIEEDLLALDGVARVQIQGARKSELRITVDPVKLEQNRISIGQIADLIRKWNVNAPGGELTTEKGQKVVRITGEFKNSSELGDLVIQANERGQGIRLSDVAKIDETLEKPTTYYDVNGTSGLNMLVLKKPEADIINVVDGIKDYLKTVSERYGAKVHVAPFQDFSRFTRLRLGVLTTNGIVGLVLVLIALAVFLRPSVAMTTTLGMPIVFCIGLFVLYLAGITLNLVSMLGFIIVLGMLVDDAIIIGENITYHMEQGMKPVQAAVEGALELVGPVTATITTTIIAFLPLMFMSGMIGKFIVAIPVVVITLLAFSWLESFIILPSHVAHFANPHKHPPERAWLRNMEHGYERILEKAVDHYGWTIFISVAVLIGSLVLAATAMSFQLFPAVAVDQYIVRVKAETGTDLDSMHKTMDGLEKEIRSYVKPEYLETTIVTTGQTQIDSNDPLLQRGSRYGQVRVIYIPAALRKEHDALVDMHYLEKDLTKKHSELKLSFDEQKNGPPTGRALEVEITGRDNVSNERVANNLSGYLKNIDGVLNVETDIQPGDDELRVVLDKATAIYAGVDLATVASHLRAAVDGLRVDTTRKGTEEVDLTIRYPLQGKMSGEQLLRVVHVPNARGGYVPLSAIAHIEEHGGYSTIRHKAGLRVVRVVANVDTAKITSIKINKLVRDNQDKWFGSADRNVTVNYGGENEKNQQSFVDLASAMKFALIGIFFILAIQFNSLGYPIIVMLAIPFGIVGIILSFYVHDLLWMPMPLSFFSIMGMVALTGVVVNSSLVMLVFIQRAIQDGMNCKDAILLAGRRRLRAVVLTAATTIAGLLPTAYGWGGMDPFVSPMALALAWGLIVATLVTLVAIPAFFAAAMDAKGWFAKRITDVKETVRAHLGAKLP